jgi:hypothetical protein
MGEHVRAIIQKYELTQDVQERSVHGHDTQFDDR